MPALDIPKQKRMTAGDLYQLATSAGEKLGKVASLGGQMLFGEDTGDGMAKDLAYGAVPGGSLFQRATTGTRPGLLDFVDFVPGGGTAVKAASLFVPMDLVKSLAKRAGANGFERKFKRLPEAVQESWISSFGDVHSDKLRKHRNRVVAPNYNIDHSLVHAYTKLNTEYPGSASYYLPFDNSVRDMGYYQPYISLDTRLNGDYLADALMHEGAHLMDNSIGTAKEVVGMPSDYKYVHPYSGYVSKDWLDASTIDRYPFSGSRHSLEYQDNTGNFSPLEYAYAKNHPLENPDSKPIYWLGDDPHGTEFYLNRQYYDWEGNPLPRTINEDKVASEGLAQFVESIPHTDLGRTPARRKLVELAERDPRRSDDFTINFDRLEDYLSQPADKYDAELKRNVVPYITSF